jgi:pyridoxamine 5'-phosphate oxidase family protein
MFTDAEITFIQSQRLAHIATVSTSMQPDVAAVTFEYDGQTFTVGGFDISGTFKYKNVAAGNDLVAIVMDDLNGEPGGKPRGIKIHGSAVALLDANGKKMLRISPRQSWSWGIETSAFVDGRPTFHRATHDIKTETRG